MTILAGDEIPCRDKRLFSLTHARRRFTMRNRHLSVHRSESFQHVYEKASGPCALIPLVTIPVIAQEPSPWVGQKVVKKYNAPLRVANQVVDDFIFRTYTVEQVNGDWLWLVSGSMKGWASISSVVPLDHATEFYTFEVALFRRVWAQRGASSFLRIWAK